MKNQDTILQGLVDLYKLKRQSFGFVYKNIEKNIEEIQTKAGVVNIGKSDQSYLNKAIWFVPPVVGQSVFLFLWILTLFCFYKIFKLKNIKSKYILIFFLTLIMGFFLIINNKVRNKNIAIVKHDTTMKLGPSKEHIVRKKLNRFSEVNIILKNCDWYKIESDSIIGWVEKDELELINNNEFK